MPSGLAQKGRFKLVDGLISGNSIYLQTAANNIAFISGSDLVAGDDSGEKSVHQYAECVDICGNIG